MCGLGLASQWYLCLIPSWDSVRQQGREWNLSLSLSPSGDSWKWWLQGQVPGTELAYVLAVGTAAIKSSSWCERSTKCSLVAAELSSPDQLCCTAHSAVPGSSASSLVLQPFQPLQGSPVPLFCRALHSQCLGPTTGNPHQLTCGVACIRHIDFGDKT